MNGIRAYAAGLVFLVHFCPAIAAALWNIPDLRLHPGMTPVEQFLYYSAKSHHGVELFFILSGFLIVRMLMKRSSSYVEYLKRRIARLYPAFLATLAFAVAVKCFLYHFIPFEWTTLGMNLIFLNGISHPKQYVVPYNAPTWSLLFELIFYVTVPLLTVFRRHLRTAISMSAVLIVLALYALQLLPYTRTLTFLAGAFVATFSDEQLRKWARSVPDWLILLGYLSLTTTAALTDLKHLVFVFSFAILGTLLVINVCLGRGWLNRLFSWKPFRYAGRVSYSFFLLHFTVTGIVMTEFERFKPILWRFQSWALALDLLVVIYGLSLVLSEVCYRLFEAPYFAGGRNGWIGS